MTILDAAKALVPLRREGDEWHGPCPSCGGEDRFFVNDSGGVADTGRYACRRCGESGNAVAFLTRHLGVSEARARVDLGLDAAKDWSRRPDVLGREVRRFAYAAPDGARTLDVVRFEVPDDHPLAGTKDGKTYRPAPPGGRAGKRPRVARHLYRAPEVAAALRAGETVFLCEGEPAAEAVASLGLCGTTSEGGAGKWGDAETRALAGADVVALPDNDDAGEGHLQMVGAALSPVARSVRVLRLPNLPRGGDAVEFVAAGGTADDLLALVGSYAEPFVPGADETEPATSEHESAVPPPRPVLDIRSGREWMEAAASMPVPRPLMGSLAFEGELTILFSETNAGKSVLAVQFADGVAAGRGTLGLPCEAGAQDVLYLDFELSAKQFERRYSRDFADPYPFAPGLYRAELDPDALADEGAFDLAVRSAIEAAVEARGFRVVVVDNLTFVGRQSQEARDALPLMRALHRLKRRYGLSMLVLGHTPKRDGTRPLTLNDLGGSRHLANFADAVVGLGRSAREPDVRYLKQLKVRSSALEFHADDVLTLRLDKPGNFLGFHPVDRGPESAHLRVPSDDERAQRDAAVLDLHAEGLSFREIGDRLGVSHMTAKRVVDRAGAQGTLRPPVTGVTAVTPRDRVTAVTRGGDGARTALLPGAAVSTPHGPGTVTAPPEAGRVSVDVSGVSGSYPIASIVPRP